MALDLSWRAADMPITLVVGHAHVFRLALNPGEARLETLKSYLTSDELERAGRFRREEHRRQSVAARGQTREVLAALTHAAPRELVFDNNPHGKPHLLGGGRLRFNLTHSSELALLAVTLDQEVGIDLEAIREDVDRENIPRRFFAPAETAALEALPPEQQLHAFFACWTRKEAYLKARGAGLTLALDQFAVSISPGEPARLLHPPPDQPPGETWLLYDIVPAPGFAACLAVQGVLQAIHYWDWPGELDL